jgi:hypothetical protein
MRSAVALEQPGALVARPAPGPAAAWPARRGWAARPATGRARPAPRGEGLAIDGGRDIDFLSGVLYKLLVNTTWWVHRLDASDRNVFAGGFLYALAMGSIPAVLDWSGQRQAQGLVLKFLEHRGHPGCPRHKGPVG